MLRMKSYTSLIVALFLGLAFPLVATAQDMERRTGEWQQLVLTNEGTWRSLGTFLVSQKDGAYSMEPIEQLRASGITNSRGLFEVNFTASEWSFHSDWGNGNIGVFRLIRSEAGVYQGWAYLNDKRLSKTLWIRVK